MLRSVSSLNFQIVDLFSSLDKQPMNTQVAVIDALEDFILDWLLRHNLSWYFMARSMQCCSVCLDQFIIKLLQSDKMAKYSVQLFSIW